MRQLLKYKDSVRFATKTAQIDVFLKILRIERSLPKIKLPKWFIILHKRIEKSIIQSFRSRLERGLMRNFTRDGGPIIEINRIGKTESLCQKKNTTHRCVYLI
jgi:hypothetical protein